ncbi:helix-turn-helix transcriptional regulator [Polaromonas sp.]|uniref:helix-turn-helix domain-containing protein n=1 Tax=Polaromonas sp. TaxID=1869339 RepID=UPI003267738B
MIRFKLGEMIEKKQFTEGRRVTVNEIAAATGLNRMTLSKILNQKGYGTGTDTVDRLCQYFDCKVEDLMEHLQEDAGLALDQSINLEKKVK